MRELLRPAVLLLVGFLARSLPLAGQDNTVDLRFLEVGEHGHLTYQNFIYSRNLAGGKWMFQGGFLRLPQIDYKEYGIGLGYRLAVTREIGWYLFGNFAHGSDEDYFQPALLALDVEGKTTGSLFLLHYAPLGSDGIDQWLVDPIEVQYNLVGRLSLGGSGYFYRPAGGSWFHKIGPKLSLSDALGASELAVRKVNRGGGVEIQLRRIFVF
jgi:hypothetical protein